MKTLNFYATLILLVPIYSSSAEKAEEFKCSAAKIRGNDTLTIDLPKNHGADLAIVDPNQNYWFIAFSQPNPKSDLKPIISEKEFQTTTKISKKVSEFKGVLWDRNKGFEAKNIFVKPGKYTVLLAPTLETEDPLIEGKCTLEFTDK